MDDVRAKIAANSIRTVSDKPEQLFISSLFKLLNLLLDDWLDCKFEIVVAEKNFFFNIRTPINKLNH